MMAKTYYVYILTNKNHTVLYTGITNDLSKRMWEHQAGLGSKFADRYRAIELVYFEVFEDPYEAISREKQIKAGPRRRKVALIRKLNPRCHRRCDLIGSHAFRTHRVHGLASLLTNHRLSFLRCDRQAGVAIEALLDRRHQHALQPPFGLGADRGIAGYQRHRHAERA